MKRLILYIVAIVAIALLVVGGLKLRKQREQELASVPPPAESAWSVRVATVKRGRATAGFPALALVKGANEINVAPRLAGIILEMRVREGHQVAKGDVLARIDTQELRDKLDSLMAQRQGAIADADRKARDAVRAEKLLKTRNISESQVDQEKSAARAAREQVRSLDKQISAERVHLDYARVTAPFAGVIASRLADPGDLAAVGKPLYRLVATDAGRLEVRLPSEILAGVTTGTEVVVSHLGKSLNLRADRVFPSLDQRSLGRLEIDVPELPFGSAPGALLRARVITEAVDDALLVTADTLIVGRDPQRARVWKLSDDSPPKVKTVPVSIVLRSADAVAVSGDLTAGDRIVTAHESTLLRLQAGDAVRVEGAGQ